MLTLAGGFIRRGHPVDLLLARATGAYTDQIPEHVRLVDFNTTRPSTAIPSLIRYLNQSRPMALLSAMTHTNFATLLASKASRVSTRIVISEHVPLSIKLTQLPHLDRWLYLSLLRLLYPQAGAIVAVSKGVAEDLSTLLSRPAPQLKVIYNPVNPELWKLKAQEPLAHPWMNEPIPVILSIGRLTNPKDFFTLIHAFAQLRKTRPARLMILGEGTLRSELEKLVKDLRLAECVELPGFVSNPHPYISQADLFVLSSRWEGLSNVVLEALAHGKPIVSTDCPYGPSEILDNGRFGRLVPVGDPDAMARAMEEVLSGRFKSEDSSRHLSQFEEDKVVDRYLEVMTDARS